MRACCVVGILGLFSTLAHADAKQDVGTLVAKVVRASGQDKQGSGAALLAKNALIVTDSGADTALPRSSPLFGPDSGEAKLEPGTPTLVVDDAHHYAWFHVVVDGSYVVELYAEHGPNRERSHSKLRVSGIAIDDHGWKIAALMFTNAISDKFLFQGTQPNFIRPAKLGASSAKPAADALVHWIYEGTLAARAAKSPTLAANGTAPAEVAAGAAAVKLARGWDALKMWTSDVEATTFADGAVAFVHGSVYLPRPDGGVQMLLGAVLVRTDDGWRWTCLNFGPVLPV
jgi:hypothetical protein